MRPFERAGHLAYARSTAFAGRLERARATIAEGLACCTHPFVGFSAGKDSGVLLHLVLEQWPNAVAQILTGGETRILHRNLDEVLDWWRAQFPALDLREVHIDHVFAEGWQDVDWRTQYDTFIGEWEKYLWTTEDWNGVFLGLRADESSKRRYTLRQRRPASGLAIMHYADTRPTVAAGGYRICPLDRWTVPDVAAYTVLHDLPLLDTYLTEGLDARTHLRTGWVALRMGQLAELRRRDPMGYNRLIQRFPELEKWT